MNTDIRLSVGFWRHPKTVKLQRRLGLEAVRSLQILWLWAAENRPSGDLSGMDDEDLAIAADWLGETEKLVGALSSIGFLDGECEGYSLHGWQENNAWASGEPTRADKGRFARLKGIEALKETAQALEAAGVTRISKADYAALVDEGTRKVTLERLLGQSQGQPSEVPQGELKGTSEDTLRQPPTPTPTPTPAPTPAPVPTPNVSLGENTCSPAGAGQRTQTAPKAKRVSVLSGKRLETFEQFWDAYDYKHGRGGAEKAWAAIPTLTDGLVEKICDAARKEAERRPAWVAKGMTPKMAQGWLNERRWEDDYDTPQPQPAQGRRPYVPQGQQGQYAGMTWGEIRNEKNKQACRNAVREYLAEKGIEMEEEEYEQPDDEHWTVTVNEG